MFVFDIPVAARSPPSSHFLSQLFLAVSNYLHFHYIIPVSFPLTQTQAGSSY